VFLRYWIDEYDSEALIELPDERELTIEVRAPAPDYFFNVLIDSLHYLFALRWPGTKPDLLVPCPTLNDDGAPCPGVYRLEFLRHRREQGRTKAGCQECYVDHDVEQLLTGFPRPVQLTVDLQRTLESMNSRVVTMSNTVERTEARVKEISAQAAESAHHLRLLLTAAQQEVDDCPRLFTLTQEKGPRVNAFERRYRLVLWCEYPGGPHPLTERSYELGQPREWFVRIRPYVAVMIKALQVAVPAAAAASTLVLPPDLLNSVQVDFDVMRDLVRDVGEISVGRGGAAELDETVGDGDGPLSRAEGEALRAFRRLLFEKDKSRRFAGLRPWLAVTEDYLWLCPHHYAEYARGFPQLPPGRPAA